MPCFESSVSTESVEGGLRPMGRGSHGLLIASFTALSITSSACTKIKDILYKFRGIYDLFVHYQSNHWINGKGKSVHRIYVHSHRGIQNRRINTSPS